MEIVGAQVYMYVKPGTGLVVSLHLDTGGVPEMLLSPEGTVPVRVTVGDRDVFAAS